MWTPVQARNVNVLLFATKKKQSTSPEYELRKVMEGIDAGQERAKEDTILTGSLLSFLGTTI